MALRGRRSGGGLVPARLVRPGVHLNHGLPVCPVPCWMTMKVFSAFAVINSVMNSFRTREQDACLVIPRIE